MARRTRTIINSLRSYYRITEANKQSLTGWNSLGHPEPHLPEREYLIGNYLERIRKSQPDLVNEAEKLVSYAGKKRGR